MSDEDAELKDVLVRSLNETGILPRLQAQLRAAVYLALEKHNYHEKIPSANAFLKNLCSTEDGLIIVSMIAEFLSYANLESTLEVFRHEAELDSLSLIDRPVLHSSLNLEDASVAGATIVKFVSSRRCNAQNSENLACKKKVSTDNSGSIPSRIPTLANRRASTSSSHDSDQPADRINPSNGFRDEAASDRPSDGDSRPSSGHSTATPVCSSQNSATPKGDFIDPLTTLEKDPQNSQPGGLELNGPTAPCSTSPSSPRVKNIKSTPSPREPEYQDDFDSPRSQGSLKTISSASSRVERTEQPQMTPRSPPETSNRSGPHESSPADRSGATTAANRVDLQSPNPLEPSTNRNDSRSSSPSVIRLYTRFKKSVPSNELDSDVDGEDEISELVKELEYSGEEDTTDQTIDSDESISLDHVEDVIVPRKPVSPA